MTRFLTTRFAPSPTGLLHLGHAFSAWTAFDAARAAGGEFILRLEDIDQTRCTLAFETSIYEDLAWLGLEWRTPVRRQSDHFDDFRTALETLQARGVLYRCFKTRKDIAADIARAPHLAPDGPEGPAWRGAALPHNEERTLIDEGRPFAWRLSINAAAEYLGPRFNALYFTEAGEGPKGERGRIKATPQIFSDPVLARKDTPTSYHLACTYDDALQNITHIVRGTDLFHATHLHVLLQALLDLPTPAYHHHRLITDENGARFAKRNHAVTLKALREAGATPDELRQRLGL